MTDHQTTSQRTPAENAGDARETVTFGVFQHSSGPQGGYVVRTMYGGWVPSPYLSVDAVRVFQREHAAQRHADKLNGREED